VRNINVIISRFALLFSTHLASRHAGGLTNCSSDLTKLVRLMETNL